MKIRVSAFKWIPDFYQLRRNIPLILLVIAVLNACLPQNQEEVLIDTPKPGGTATPTHPPSPTEAAFAFSGGPFLLLQSTVDAYSIINFTDQTVMDFDVPGFSQQINLAENLSPSGTQMLIPVAQDEIQVYSFVTGNTLTTYHLSSDSDLFQVDQAVEKARAALPDLKYSDEALLSAIKNALTRSKTNIQWYRNDRYRLIVLENSATSTQLTLDDQQTGMREPLEDQPALVEDYWAEPSGDWILIKKSYIFEPGVWQDDRYFLVDSQNRQAVPIELPEDADNPLVFWFAPGQVGIIHQPAPMGGINFSIVDTNSITTKLLVSGPFNGLRRFGEGLLTFAQDRENESTTLNLRDSDGQITQTEEIKGLCFFSVGVGRERVVMNCGLQSYMVEFQDQNLAVTPFGSALFLLASSPDGNMVLRLNQDSTAILLDGSLNEVGAIILESEPLEIRWLPDSSGFLYRTPLSLYFYQIETQTSAFLLDSDLFSDYRNLNAVWIRFDEWNP